MNSSFNNYFKDQEPIDLSTAPSSSNINLQMDQSNRSNISNLSSASNNQFSSSSSSNFFNNVSLNQPISNTTSTYWNQQPQSQHAWNSNAMRQSMMGPIPNVGNSEIEYYKNTIRIKENFISQLEHEITKLQKINQKQNLNSSNSLPDHMTVPSNYIQVFEKLSSKLFQTEEELKDTKLRLDCLITSILSNPSNSVTKNGRFDELETFEKILIKLKNLETENLELLKVSSFGKVKQFQLDLNFKELKIESLMEENQKLKKENEELNKLLKQFKK